MVVKFIQLKRDAQNMNPELEALLKQDGFIIFIEGKKGSGKTNYAMRLIELCHKYNFRSEFATNIETKCDYVRKIDNYPELEQWLRIGGKKLYVLDEAGKHIKKMRFMTDQNVKFMELLQLIRHYDAGFIGVAPSSSFVDSQFLNTDILDARIRKLSRVTAKVIDYTNHAIYTIHGIPKTSIRHNSKDIALFKMEGKRVVDPHNEYELFKQYLIEEHGVISKVRKRFNPEMHNTTAERYLERMAKEQIHIPQAYHEVEQT